MGGHPPLRFEVVDHVATIVLDDPDRRNALSSRMLDALGDAVRRAASDDEVRVVVLTNRGPTFCAGADLRGTGGAQPRYGLADVLAAIQDAPKPVVGKIAGSAFGGGLGLVAACDISIASASARFGFTEVRVGVAPAIISVVCLPKLSRAAALELFLTGARFDAARAVEVGLLNRAVDDGELDAAVEALVAMLLEGAPGAQRAAKRLVYEVPSLERDAAFARMTERSAALFASPEAREGMTAFRERRRPAWAPEARERATGLER
jgi:methylglutaconyl-CoA hydratase